MPQLACVPCVAAAWYAIALLVIAWLLAWGSWSPCLASAFRSLAINCPNQALATMPDVFVCNQLLQESDAQTLYELPKDAKTARSWGRRSRQDFSLKSIPKDTVCYLLFSVLSSPCALQLSPLFVSLSCCLVVFFLLLLARNLYYFSVALSECHLSAHNIFLSRPQRRT